MEKGLARRASDISGQQKNVVIIEPLARLESDGNLRAVILQNAGASEFRLDTRLIALCMLDHIMEETAFHPGALADSIILVGMAAAMKMNSGIGEDAAKDVSKRIYDYLRNATGRYNDFHSSYYDLEHGDWRAHSFCYIKSLPDPDDTTVTWMRLGTGGKKLLLGMLDVADDLIEDAERTIMAKALDRGRYQDAQAAASRMRSRSSDFRQRIDSEISTAKRAWRTVDISTNVIPVLDAAMKHVSQRMTEDRCMVARLDDKISELIDPEQRIKAVELRSTLQDCLSIHGKLFRRMTKAHGDLRTALIKGLRTTGVMDCRNPETDILLPLLNAPIGVLTNHAGLLAAAFSATEVTPILNLLILFEEIVADHPASADGTDADIDAELVMFEKPTPMFSPKRVDEVMAWLDAATGQRMNFRLSEIIGEAVAEGFDVSSLRLLVLLAIKPLSQSPAMRLDMGIEALHFDLEGDWNHGSIGGDDIVFHRTA